MFLYNNKSTNNILNHDFSFKRIVSLAAWELELDSNSKCKNCELSLCQSRKATDACSMPNNPKPIRRKGSLSGRDIWEVDSDGELLITFIMVEKKRKRKEKKSFGVVRAWVTETSAQYQQSESP